jgi:hypothetical protein
LLVLDGRPSPRGGRVAATGPAAEFIAALPGLATVKPHVDLTDRVRGLADEIARVEFTTPDGFDSLRFWPLGLPGRRRSDPFGQARRSRTLVMAPYATQDFLATLRDRGVRLLYEVPKGGTAGSRVNFIHPKDAGGVLVELVEPGTDAGH